MPDSMVECWLHGLWEAGTRVKGIYLGQDFRWWCERGLGYQGSSANAACLSGMPERSCVARPERCPLPLWLGGRPMGG